MTNYRSEAESRWPNADIIGGGRFATVYTAETGQYVRLWVNRTDAVAAAKRDDARLFDLNNKIDPCR